MTELTTLTWLHLSDWHQDDSQLANRRIMREALLRDIESRIQINDTLGNIDFIIFSGDLAFSGKECEYRIAREQLLDPILQTVRLGAERLFIVPGNHDFDRAERSIRASGLLHDFSREDDVEKWLKDDVYRSYILKPFEAYSQFIESYLGTDQTACASVRIIDNGQVALLGLNTALMCDRERQGEEKGCLVVGEQQVADALRQTEHASIRIAVMHHPFDWLADFDKYEIEKNLGENCHFILCGHVHEPGIKAGKGSEGDCVVIPAGACYNGRVAEHPRFTSSYNFVHLDFKQKQGTIYQRRWSDPSKTWVEDVDTYPRRPSGQFLFPIPKVLQNDLPVTRTTANDGSGPPIRAINQQEKHTVKSGESINSAISTANAGDRITILPGMYDEELVIDKPLEIVGKGKREQIIIRSTHSGQDVISFKTNMGYLSNITLQQKAGGDGCSVRILQGRLNLENCDMTSEGRACIVIQGGATPHVYSNRIHDSKVGVYIHDHGQGTLADNDIFNNDIGVEIYDGDPLLLDNRIYENNQSGVFIEQQGQGRLEGNDIYGNAYTGVEINGGTPGLRYNHIHDGKAGGIYVHNGSRGMIEYNDIYQNTLSGVAIQGDKSTPTLRYNDIHNNMYGGVHVSEGGIGLLERNDIYENFHAEIEIKTGGNPTIKGNRLHNGKEGGIFVSDYGRGKIEDNQIFENFYAGVSVQTNGAPIVKNNRVSKNRQAVWIDQEGGGQFENNDLLGNSEPSVISLESQPKITWSNNTEAFPAF
jgi:parallel beta-helix repeat protein